MFGLDKWEEIWLDLDYPREARALKESGVS